MGGLECPFVCMTVGKRSTGRRAVERELETGEMSGSRTRSISGVDADGADVWKDVNSPLRVKAEMEHANSDDELTDIESIISKIKSLSSTGTDSSNGCSSSDISQRYFEDINDCAEVLEQKFLLNSNKILTARVVKLVNCDYQVGWIADCDVSDCMLCCTSFGWLKRRHHCRSCGLCVCARCSPSKAEVANLVAEEPLSRVCNKCHDFEVRGVISDRGHDDSVKSGFTTKPLTIDEYISMARHSNRSGIQYEVYGSIFEKAQALRCEKSYRMMRGRIPVDVAKVTLKVLLTRDVLPAAVAAHLWSTKALWLIVMHKEDILKVRTKLHQRLAMSRYFYLSPSWLTNLRPPPAAHRRSQGQVCARGAGPGGAVRAVALPAALGSLRLRAEV